MQKLLYSQFQETNPEKFNDELIFQRKKESNELHSYFVDLFKTIILPGIEFLGSRTITDEYKYDDLVHKTSISIEESRLDLIEAKFKLTHEEETKEVAVRLYFPKLVDNYFFHINGNRYYAIYQISDKNWYSVRKGIFLKTLLMPLGLKFDPVKMCDTDGNIYNGKNYLLDFLTTKTSTQKTLKNIFVYFFIKFGYKGTLDFLGMTDYVEIIESLSDIKEDHVAFLIKKNQYLSVNKLLLEDQNTLNIVTSLFTVISEVKRSNNLDNIDYWKKKILNSPTAKLTKADRAIFSLERILDERTKKNLRNIPDEQKQDVWCIMTHMMFNFEELWSMDNVDLNNRRLRLYEYMIYPLLAKFSEISYRILNSRNIDMKRLQTVFSNIGSMFLIRRLVTNELMRYSNATNSMELFSVALRWSGRGAQALGSSSSSTMIKYRGIHPSYLGNIGMHVASASDPGLSGTINPFTNNIHDMFFEIDKNNIDI